MTTPTKPLVSRRAKGIFLVLFGSICWGISGTVAQYLFEEQGFQPEWLVDVRLLSAGLLLLLFCGLVKRQNVFAVWKNAKQALQLLLFSLVGMLGVQYAYFCSIAAGNAATATILQCLSTVLIAVYTVLRTRRPPHAAETAGVLLALAGTFLIVTRGSINSLAMSLPALFWGLVCAFAAAFYTLLPAGLLKKWDAAVVVGWGMLVGGAAFAPIGKLWHFTGRLSAASAAAVLFIILFGSVVAFYCYLESTRHITPTQTSVLASVEPLSAVVVSVLWLHVPIGPVEWLGMACIIATVVLLALARK